MLVVVTFVSALVHIYSIGYMVTTHINQGLCLIYRSLFNVALLYRIISATFFGWEGVGLCSYLLIGFWYKREKANNAANKAL